VGRAININEKVTALYLEELLPGITQPGDDGNYGSAAMHDVLALQALSKRIHYGKFVAEAKFRARPDEYSDLIRKQDAAGLMQLLTDEAVEQKVVDRVRRKAATYGQDIQLGGGAAAAANGTAGGAAAPQYKVSPDLIADLYNRWVMPMTKDVQVAYLLRRLD
jgi:chorismate mutase